MATATLILRKVCPALWICCPQQVQSCSVLGPLNYSHCKNRAKTNEETCRNTSRQRRYAMSEGFLRRLAEPLHALMFLLSPAVPELQPGSAGPPGMLYMLQFPTQTEHLSELAKQSGNRCVLSALQRASVAISTPLFVFIRNASRVGRAQSEQSKLI